MSNTIPPTKAKQAARKAQQALQESSNRKVRTLSLDDAHFVRLKRLCADRDWTVSAVVDELIEAFLALEDGG